MKKIILISIIQISCNLFLAQAQSCCSKPEGMAIFASNENFITLHAEPVAFEYTSEKGGMISFKTPDNKEGKSFYVPSSVKTNKVVLVFHEWWGLNDYIKQEAEKLQKQLGNVDVYALDLYDGQVATEREMASKLMNGLNPERAKNIIKGLLTQIGTDKKIATIGWCMGGGYSLQASLLAGSQADACVMYYGFPEKDIEKLKNLHAEILFIQALQDGFITSEVVNEFTESMKNLNKKITVKQYDAVHAFANPSNPNHNKVFTEESYKLTIEFLKKGLGL